MNECYNRNVGGFMEKKNLENNNPEDLLIQLEAIFNNYLKSIKDKSQLSEQESQMMYSFYINLLKQIKNLLETFKAAEISLQQIEFNTNQEHKNLDELYNNAASNNHNNPTLEIICNLHNELNALYNLPTTTISEIQRKYFLMNNHFMKANYYINSVHQNQNQKYKKPEKNT